MAPSTMSVKETGTCWETRPREGTFGWLRGVDLNHRPLGYEPNELPDCSTPRKHHSNLAPQRQTCPTATAARASSVLQLVALTRRHDLGWIDSLAVHLLFQDFPIFADQEIHPA